MSLALAYFALYGIVFLFGSAVGSFINVVIYRLPLGRSPAAGRSACTSCGHTLAPQDLLPVLSWLLLRGRCRYCGAPVAVRYPLVEALCGGLAVLLALRYGLTLQLLLAFAVAAVAVAISFIDLDTMTIPDSLIIALGACGLLSVFINPGLLLWSRGAAMLAVSLPLWLITLAVKDAFGGGDIKLMAAAGLYLGLPQVLLAFFLALLGGGAYACWMLLHGGKGKHFAFGPFLCGGIVLSLLCGQELAGWYVGLFLH